MPGRSGFQIASFRFFRTPGPSRTQVYQVFEQLRTYLTAASDIVGGWENLAAILGGIAFGQALVSTAAASFRLPWVSRFCPLL